MAHGQQSGSQRDAALRRVAIVLSSLPPSAASVLLGSMEPESKQLLRRTMATLSDVDPLERQRALQAFKGSLTNPVQESPSAGADRSGDVTDEISIGGEAGAKVVSTRISSDQVSTATASPFGFLGEVGDDTLVKLMGGEHPQTIALVLASIAADQAARILPRLDAKLQADALSRIGRLGETPNDVVTEIANHLRQRIESEQQSATSESGFRALQAILAAMPNAAAQAPVAPQTPSSPFQQSAVQVPEAIANRLASQPTPIPSGNGPSGNVSDSGHVDGPIGFSKDDLSAVDQTHRLRLVAETELDESPASPAGSDPDAGQEPPQTLPFAAPQRPSFGSTDSINEHLVNLPSDVLCEALGRVSTREMMLALCGLPNDVGEAALAILPRAHARKVRRGIASLQSLQLREIDKAKEAVALASLEIDEDEGEQPLESPVRMAA